MTRARLTLVGLVAAGAGLLSAAPASADCNVAVLIATGRCVNACTIVHEVLPPGGPCLA